MFVLQTFIPVMYAILLPVFVCLLACLFKQKYYKLQVLLIMFLVFLEKFWVPNQSISAFSSKDTIVLSIHLQSFRDYLRSYMTECDSSDGRLVLDLLKTPSVNKQQALLINTDLTVGITGTLSHRITQFPLNNLRVSDSKSFCVCSYNLKELRFVTLKYTQ